MWRSYNPFKRFMLGGGGVQPAPASRMSSLRNENEPRRARLEFLVGGQKFMRVKAEPLRGCVASLDPHGEVLEIATSVNLTVQILRAYARCASRMSSLINKTREQFALSFEFLVGSQKFGRVKARFAFQP